MPYTVYLLLCADGTYYTGITTDIERRLQEHNTSPKGARYTASRRPVVLAYSEQHPDRSSALKREYILRTLPRHEKAHLCMHEVPAKQGQGMQDREASLRVQTTPGREVE